MRPVLLLLLLFACAKLFAQPTSPSDYGLQHHTIQDKKLGLISFYVDTVNLKKKSALFIDVNGSGGYPLCLYVKSKGQSTVMNTFHRQVLEKTKVNYHYIILDKPGTPFCDTVATEETKDGLNLGSVLENYRPTAEYTQRLSLEWRVAATKRVITYLIKNKYWNRTKIIAYGYSEGGQVVPTLAVSDKRVTHVVSVVGAGLNQFYDGLTAIRIRAAKGEITHRQAQDDIDSYLKTVRDIYRYPEDVERSYAGHSFKRWASFGSVIPFEELRKLSIPIYMVAGTSDESSPIYGLDYVMLDFIRLGKTNLTFDTCVACDHGLTAFEGDKRLNRFDTYFEKILEWVNTN